MRVSVGQIYIKPGVSFPFSHVMQRWLGEELTAAADDSTEFAKKYGPGFSLVVRLSADTSIASNVIKGPTVFRRDKDVEYTVFLPFEVIMTASNGCGAAMRHLIDGVRVVFRLAGIESSSLDAKESSMIEHVCSEPTMLEEPWPLTSTSTSTSTSTTASTTATTSATASAAADAGCAGPESPGSSG